MPMANPAGRQSVVPQILNCCVYCVASTRSTDRAGGAVGARWAVGKTFRALSAQRRREKLARLFTRLDPFSAFGAFRAYGLVAISHRAATVPSPASRRGLQVALGARMPVVWAAAGDFRIDPKKCFTAPHVSRHRAYVFA